MSELTDRERDALIAEKIFGLDLSAFGIFQAGMRIRERDFDTREEAQRYIDSEDERIPYEMHRSKSKGVTIEPCVRAHPAYSTSADASKQLLLRLRELGYEIHTEVYPVSVIMEDPRSIYFDHSGVPFYTKLIRRVGKFAIWETRQDTPEKSLALCVEKIARKM